MQRLKRPRSTVIDQELLKVRKGAKPNWDEIATVVINDGRAPESERKHVISQARTRYKWYTVEGKANPSGSPIPNSAPPNETVHLKARQAKLGDNNPGDSHYSF